MSSILSVRQVTKNYGRIRALHELSFEVPQGSVFGILGPNGSGKTTLLGILMDVLRCQAGSFSWFEQPPSATIRKQIGCLLETPNFYHYLSGKRNLEIAAAIKGVPQKDVLRVLELVRLAERKDSRFNTYSLGMKQRLAIGSCLLGNPAVLVLDEPTNGLDPAGIAEIRQLIRDLAKDGRTIILASHLLDEVEKVCTHVAILQFGELITAGPVHEVLVEEDQLEAAAADMDALEKLAANFPGVKKWQRSGPLIFLFFDNGQANLARFNQYCFEQGLVLSHLNLRRRSLESKFIELTRNTIN